MNTLTVLSPQMGIWVRVTGTEDVDLPFMGALHSGPVAIELYKGWNLVGYPSLNGTVSMVESFIGLPWDMVQFSDPTRPYNLRYMPVTMKMEPGRGYWVHVTADCTWNV